MIHRPMTTVVALRFVAALLLLANLVAAATAASLPAVEARRGMVVSAHRLASQAGLDILERGGNAIDAAVAVGYALAVVDPCCGNIGGGGFMTLRLADGRTRFIDFREKAPAAAGPELFLGADGQADPRASLDGYRAVAVPGTVLGLDTALARYGRLSRAEVMRPAIGLARQGFVLARADTDLLDSGAERLRRDPAAAAIFLRPDGSVWRPGDRLRQPDLARTLTALARTGPAAFYAGKIPRAVEQAAQASGGVITAADFSAYAIAERTPLSCRYRGHEFVSAPPPSSGGTTLCEILQVLEGYDLKASGFNSAATINLMVEAMRQAYIDRNALLGDPDFVANPVGQLLSPGYAASIRARIVPGRATPSSAVTPASFAGEKPETTHYSVVDGEGNAVAVTFTVNGRFGAGVVAPGTGFLLNNEMDDFATRPGAANLYGLVQGAPNAIAPGKRPLSSMAPTLVLRDGRLFMALGTPGGPRIISAVLQVALNVIDHGMAPQEAVDAPRVHHQGLPDTLYVEARGLSPDTAQALTAMGYRLVEQAPWGGIALIVAAPPGARGAPLVGGNDSALSGGMRPGYLYGANDSRRPAGAALGR